MNNRETIFTSSGLSGGINSELVINTEKILGDRFNIIKIQFAQDPEYKDESLKDYSEISLEEVFAEFDKSLGISKPQILIGHSFSALLIMFYLLDREEMCESVDRIILLDPSDINTIYPYLINNKDGFKLDTSIIQKLSNTSNLDLINAIKEKGIQVTQLDADKYNTDHEFTDIEKLAQAYKDANL